MADDTSKDRGNGAECNTVEDKEEQAVTLLRDAVQASTSPVDNRAEYQLRLLSFHAFTYYAKPACLSPLFCARFGWRNADEDMLSCSSCASAVAVLPLPSALSPASLHTICQAYRQKIVNSHEEDCPFRVEDASQLDSNDDGLSFVVPPYMASILPEESVSMLEHPAPHDMMRKRSNEIETILLPNNNSSSKAKANAWKYPRLQVPTEIQQFASSTAKDVLGTDDESIVALAVLGWQPIKRVAGAADAPTISLGCPLCMAFMELECVVDSKTNKGKESNNRPSKRMRKLAKSFDPQEAHRYYCPYRCGFPTSITDKKEPAWKVVLQRLEEYKKGSGKGEAVKETGADEAVPLEDMDESIRKMRKILRSGIAPVKIDL